MSNRSVRVILKNPPSWLPNQFRDSDGKYSFDLNTDTSIAITKQIDDISEVGSIKQDTIRNFTLPLTKKNIAFLGEYGNPNTYNFSHFSPLDIEIVIDMLYVLPENEFRVKGVSENRIEVEAYGEANRWIKPLSNLAIKELEFGLSGNFNFNLLFSLHQNNYIYDEAYPPVNIPYVNYGKRARKKSISIEDLRFWHSAYYIIKQGFCKIGWQINCPLLETDLGRRMWVYILSENFADSVAATNTGFLAILDNDVLLEAYDFGANGTVIFDNDSVPPAFDNGNLYSTVTGRFQGTGSLADFKAIIQVDGLVLPTTGQNFMYLEIRKINTTSGVGTTMKQEIIYELVNGINTFTIEANDVYLDDNEQIFVIALGGAFSGTIKANASKFWNVPKATTVKEDDIVDLQSIIHDDYKVLDIVKGVAHLFNLKADTDSITQTVNFYPEDESIWYTIGVQEGFFYPNSKAKDWTEKVKCDSLEVAIDSNRKRNFLLQFRDDSSDFKAKNTQFTYPLHSKNVDFGDIYQEGTEKSINPFFAPTYNDFDFDIGWIDDTGAEPNAAPYIPFIWRGDKNDSGELPKPVTKIVPRILLSYPLQRMIVPTYKENSFPTTGDLILYKPGFPNGIDRQELYAPFGQIFPLGFYGETGVGSGVPVEPLLSEEAIVYGTDEYNNTLEGNYEIFYKKSVSRLYKSIPLDFLIKLSLKDFLDFSPRDKIYLTYKSKIYGQISFYARVGAITDYIVNKNISTPVLLQPDSSNFEIECCSCFIYIDFLGYDSENNQLSFIVQLAGECGEIISYTWEHDDTGGSGTYVVGNNFNNQIIIIGGEPTLETDEFTLDITVVSSCGTYQANINHP